MIITHVACGGNIRRPGYVPVKVNMCVRCGETDAPDPLGYCATCAVQVRVELSDGFKRLRSYLAAWAAFDAWLHGHDEGPALA